MCGSPEKNLKNSWGVTEERIMKIKTEHNGAKNGGGAWMKRADAKKFSNKARRAAGKKLTRER